MDIKILEEPFGKLALALAKWALHQSSDTKLTTTHFAYGLALAAKAEPSQVPKAFEAYRDVFDAALAAAKFTGDAVSEEGKVELDEKFRQLLHDCGSDLEAFLKRLAVTLGTDSYFSNDDVTVIQGYATALAKKIGAEKINQVHFLIGAWRAFQDGRFSENAVVSSALIANVPAVEALIQRFEWQKLTPGIAYTSDVLPFDDELQKNMAEAWEARSPLLSVLNLGIAAGTKILSKERTAYHEAGHAIVSYVLRPELAITRVTIADGEGFDGCTFYDDSSPYWERLRQQDFKATVRVALAGRIAEQIRFGLDQGDDGASSDIKQATKLAWNAIANAGLDDEFGPTSLEVVKDLIGSSHGYLFDLAQQRLQRTMTEAAQDVDAILRENWGQVEQVVQALQKGATIEGAELLEGLALRTLNGVPGAVFVENVNVVRDVVFAERTGVVETLEGPVRHDVGDAIVQGSEHERWPVARVIFEQRYVPEDGQALGENGRYRKKAKTVLALQMDNDRRVDLKGGRGILQGKKGDWIVDYGEGDLAVVAAAVFQKTYAFKPMLA